MHARTNSICFHNLVFFFSSTACLAIRLSFFVSREVFFILHLQDILTFERKIDDCPRVFYQNHAFFCNCPRVFERFLLNSDNLPQFLSSFSRILMIYHSS